MTAREKLKEKGVNLNTAIGVMTILGMVLTGAFFIAPLRTLPAQQEKMQDDVHEMKRTQAVQTEALKTLAEVAADSKQIRSDVIRHDAEIQEARRRLDRLESR